MSRPIPLGESEGLRLEFKEREALENPASIARAVVALLNAQGGEVWIGIEERDGRAVAVQGISVPERAMRRLRDHLLDSIAPSPSDEEVSLTSVSDEAGSTVFVLRAKPQEGRRPYAFRKEGGWHFLLRVGDRVRPMSREEVLQPKSSVGAESRVVERLRKEKEALEGRKAGLFWVRIQPLVPARVPRREGWLDEWLWDPRRTGNRPMGWNFTHPSRESERKVDRLVHGRGTSRHTEVFWDGGLSFRTRLENLHWKGPERDIWPYILLEFPVSLFRLARAMYERIGLPREAEVAGDLAIFGSRGWTLRARSPQHRDYRFEEGARLEKADDLVLDDPLTFLCQEILEEPDRCAVRLVSRVYEEFGYAKDEIPQEFDRVTGRLVIPE